MLPTRLPRMEFDTVAWDPPTDELVMWRAAAQNQQLSSPVLIPHRLMFPIFLPSCRHRRAAAATAAAAAAGAAING